MKVKKACYMRSLTAVLGLSNPKNSSDSNKECENWYNTVPSITYIWTRKPQWRRRHKNRKKIKSIPVSFINSEVNEDEKRYFWDSLRLQGRPCSRSSTSPYETSSSKKILTESELIQNSGSQRNREFLMFKKINNFANRKVLVSETHSDSGLQNFRGTKLLGLTRSQKRLGVVNFSNTQNTVGTLSSLEVNRSVQLLVCKALQSENSLPKRRVTFSNYVSENSVIDTRSQINSIIMNDNEASDISWSRRSYVRLSDDEDNFSMQTDLSCLISSIIFDDSKTSFLSPTSEKISDNHKKSNADLNNEFNGTFFYVNSSYSNGSSCNLLSLAKKMSSDNIEKKNGSSLIQKNYNNANDFEEKIFIKKLSKSSLPFNEIVSVFKIPENVTTENENRLTSFLVDDVKKKIEEKQKQLSLSNDFVSVFENREEIMNHEIMNSRNTQIVDLMKKKFDEEFSSSVSKKFTPENLFEINKIVTNKKIIEESKPKFRSSHTSCVINVKNKLEDNLSQLNNIIPTKTEDITTDFIYNRTLPINDATKKKVQAKLSPKKDMNSLFKTPEDITTANLCNPTSHTNNFVKNEWRENFIGSNQIVSDMINAEETKTKNTYGHNSYTVDVTNKNLEKNQSSLHDINSLLIETEIMSNHNLNNFAKFQPRKNFLEPNKKFFDTEKAEEIKNQFTCNRMLHAVEIIDKKLEGNQSQSNPSKDINPIFQKFETIPTRFMNNRIRYSEDFSKNQFEKNVVGGNKKSCGSNEIVSVLKKTENFITESVNNDFLENRWKKNQFESNKIISDIEIPAKIECDSKNDSFECITIELKDISSSVKEIVIESQIESDNKASMPKNDISTDTNDLIIINHISSLDPKTQLVNNDLNHGILSIREIFNFLQEPQEKLDASLLFEEFKNVGKEDNFRNYDGIKNLNCVSRKESKINSEKIVDQVELFRIDTETCGEYESIYIEMKKFSEDLEKNEIMEKRSSLRFRNCFKEPCGSFARNLNQNSKDSKIVGSSKSRFNNEYVKCSAGNKCCLICGRKSIDNPRYIRPVCRVKGETLSPHSKKDPWINVIKKVVNYDNGMKLIPHSRTTSKNEEISKDEKLTEESSENSVFNTHQQITVKEKIEIPKDTEKKSENIIRNEEKKEECLNVIITEPEEPSNSIPPVKTNMPSSRKDQSTSCCPPELHSSTSFGFATFKGLRTQSAKTYFMRESVKTSRVTANRLLCVISESNSLMALPPFLPKKPPNWFVRQMPTRRWLKR